MRQYSDAAPSYIAGGGSSSHVPRRSMKHCNLSVPFYRECAFNERAHLVLNLTRKQT
jgi:hypothetical protein